MSLEVLEQAEGDRDLGRAGELGVGLAEGDRRVAATLEHDPRGTGEHAEDRREGRVPGPPERLAVLVAGAMKPAPLPRGADPG